VNDAGASLLTRSSVKRAGKHALCRSVVKYSFLAPIRMKTLAVALFALASVLPASAYDPGVVKELTAKGAKFTETKGAVSGADVADISKWTDEDFQKLASISGLEKLSFGKGLNDHQLSILVSNTQISAFVTNGAELSDEGVKQFARFPKLQALTFFHPGKAFAGPGLAALADLPLLDNLTVAGSSAFGNEGVDAIARLGHLKSLRVFHTNADQSGIAKISGLKNLTSLMIGQRLSNTPPVALSDQTMKLVASFPAMESLTFSEARLSLPALSQLRQLSKLKRLTLDSIDLGSGKESDLAGALPGVQIKYTAPNEAGAKRIKALFGSGS